MINMGKYIPAEKLKTKIKERIEEAQSLYKPSLNPFWAGQISAFQSCLNILDSLQQEQPELPTIKGWIARDDLDRLGLYDQKPTRKTKLGAFSGVVHPWEIGDTWIGRFSLDQAAKPLFPNLCWTDDPMEVEIMFNPIQEQPEVDLDAEIAIYLNRNVLNRINNSDIIEDFTTIEAGELASHFYELGLNARKEE